MQVNVLQSNKPLNTNTTCVSCFGEADPDVSLKVTQTRSSSDEIQDGAPVQKPSEGSQRALRPWFIITSTEENLPNHRTHMICSPAELF